MEDFENKLNDKANEVNNLDLNSDDQVDYIGIVEEVEGDTHVLILRAGCRTMPTDRPIRSRR